MRPSTERSKPSRPRAREFARRIYMQTKGRPKSESFAFCSGWSAAVNHYCSTEGIAELERKLTERNRAA